MDYKDYLDVYYSLLESHSGPFSDAEWDELQKAGSRYLDAARAAAAGGDCDAFISISDFYSCYQKGKDGMYIPDNRAAEEVFLVGQIWKKDISLAVACAQYSILNGNYALLTEMRTFFADTDSESGNNFILRVADEIGKVLSDPGSIVLEDLKLIGRKFLAEYSENAERFSEDDTDIRLNYVLDNLGESILHFGTPAVEQAMAVIEGKTTVSAPVRRMIANICGYISDYYLCNGDGGIDDARSAYYYAMVIRLEAEPDIGLTEEVIADHRIEFRYRYNIAILNMAEVIGEKRDQLIATAKLADGLDVSVELWKAVDAFTGGQYDLCASHLVPVIKEKIHEEKLIVGIMWQICQFKMGRKDFQSFAAGAGALIDEFVKDEDEIAIYDTFMLLFGAEMDLAVQRLAFYITKTFRTPGLLMYVGDFLLNPAGDISPDTEQAYKVYSEAAKMGSKEAEEKLTHFKRSLFGKMTYIP